MTYLFELIEQIDTDIILKKDGIFCCKIAIQKERILTYVEPHKVIIKSNTF